MRSRIMPGAQTFLHLVLAFYFSFYFISVPAQQPKGADFIFEGFKDSNLSLTGVAKIDSRGILELTNVTQRLQGHAVYPFPLQFKELSRNYAFSFSTSFVMSIVPEYPTLGGHGLAFVVRASRNFEGSLPSQYLGMFNSTNNEMPYNKIFAVEFDTVQDFEFNDIDDNHVGVDINGLVSNKSVTASFMNESGLYQKFNLKAEKSIQCWIDFDGGNNLLNISVIPGGMSRPQVPLISMHLNLSGVVEEFMYVGFSSSTGLLSSKHSVLGWSFRMHGPARDLDPSKLPAILESQSKDKPNRIVIGVSVAAVVVIAVAVFAGFHIVRRLRDFEVIEDWELEYGPHRFSYKELRVATKGFRDKELLGAGGFGRVYKGVLPSNGLEVAVKRVSHESKQGLKEFIAEVSSIGRLRHRNLVQLQGWCRYRGELLLVYDFMPNGSLDRLLFENSNVLGWEQRYIILKCVASGLLYLHEEWEQRVVHRDVKASNVLLDADMNGKLGDFGLARLYEHGTNPHTTHVVGTLGYLAPELTRTGKATTCTDVFAFGAMLLEVACGRRPIEPKYSSEELVLVDWVWEMHSIGKILHVVDPKLRNDYVVREAELVLQLGLLCSHPQPEGRPHMRQVVQMLAGDMAMPALPSEAPSADTPRSQTTRFFDDLVVSFSSYKQSSFNTNSHASASSTPDGRLPLSLIHGRD